MRVGELKDAEAFAAKLRILNNDGAKRFGDKWQYDVEADIEKYIEISRKVHFTLSRLYTSRCAHMPHPNINRL